MKTSHNSNLYSRTYHYFDEVHNVVVNFDGGDMKIAVEFIKK